VSDCCEALSLDQVSEPYARRPTPRLPPGFNTLEQVGNVTRKTNAVAVKGIMQSGLRSDFNQRGDQRGRTGVMANPFGNGDLCKNMCLQRGEGRVRILISMHLWWHMFGIHEDRSCDVRVYAAGSGALLFANVNPYIATVISTDLFVKVLMHHAVNDSFTRTMRESGVQDSDDPTYGSACPMPAYRRNWFSVFSRPLADASLPPADTHTQVEGEDETIHFQCLSITGNIHTPQMGIDSKNYPWKWLYSSDTASFADMANLVAKHPAEIAELMDEARARVVTS
jgi:hypothetical protein